MPWSVRAGRNEPGSDMERVTLYRPEFFGKPFKDAEERAMRGASEWSFGERQLLAAFVSKLNGCAFWTETYRASASEALADGKLVDQVLDDWRRAPIDDRQRATFAFLEKLTLSPEDVGPEDIVALGTAAVSYLAVEDAILVSTLVNIVDRLADALDFEVSGAGAVLR